MALIRKQELVKLSRDEIVSRLKELRLELTKAQVTAHRATAKTKEIKRNIARLLTRLASPQQEAQQR